MSELWPQAEAKDMEVVTTTWLYSVKSCAGKG